MKITKEEVLHVARLARLDLDDGEVDQMTVQLDAILTYVAKLDELDTADTAVTIHPHRRTNVFREDEVHPSLSRELALSGSAEHNGEAFVVPRIIG
ncbi:MAG: Asp-tRNA(Asn)/Glu-tRNA(Gln) amidotransferase subunit GatC [Desulfobulbus sp.]|nr:Asp-tRNA(Asn)/Glu-tRNA(Gln) amidotransferase subunit GatC [Desulfobulbus sp.]